MALRWMYSSESANCARTPSHVSAQRTSGGCGVVCPAARSSPPEAVIAPAARARPVRARSSRRARGMAEDILSDAGPLASECPRALPRSAIPVHSSQRTVPVPSITRAILSRRSSEVSASGRLPGLTTQNETQTDFELRLRSVLPLAQVLLEMGRQDSA